MNSRHKILIVDDNITNIEIIEEMFNDEYIIQKAASGEQAVQTAANFEPEIVLLDIMLPGIDGYEVCRQLRANPQLKHTKILMVSAKAMLAERLEGYQAGADDYITKPFEEHEFMAKIKVYLRLRSFEQLDRLKTETMKRISEETNAPIKGIVGMAKVLMSDMADEEMDREQRLNSARIIYDSAAQLEKLIERVMAISQLRTAMKSLDIQPADIAELIKKRIDAASETAEANGVVIENNLPELPQAEVDPQLIAMVVDILLDNAIKYGYSAGTVKVELQHYCRDIFIRITDHGPGIDTETMPYIFDEFRTEPVQTSKNSTGLSLPLAKEIVKLHNGEITVQSDPSNATVFTVRLPLKNGESKKENKTENQQTTSSCLSGSP